MAWDSSDFFERAFPHGLDTHGPLCFITRPAPAPARAAGPRSPFVFTSERGAPFSTAGFVRMIERAGTLAKLGFKAHPHMLRHACGYKLANNGHDTRALQAYLGHKNIQHTVRYTELAPTRFKDFWRK
jgi:site-specific recombinase XerD